MKRIPDKWGLPLALALFVSLVLIGFAFGDSGAQHLP